MVGSNGIWPDGEPQQVREAYDNQPPSSRAARREIPMTSPMTPYEEEQFLRMSPADQQRTMRDLELAIGMTNVLINIEGIMALDRLCKIYGIK